MDQGIPGDRGEGEVSRVPPQPSALAPPCPHDPCPLPVALSGSFWLQGVVAQGRAGCQPAEKVAFQSPCKAFNSPFLLLFSATPPGLYQQHHHSLSVAIYLKWSCFSPEVSPLLPQPGGAYPLETRPSRFCSSHFLYIFFSLSVFSWLRCS